VPAETIGTLSGDFVGDNITVDVPTDTTSTTTNAGTALDFKNPLVIIALSAIVILAIIVLRKE
jgi:hypothetical protein